MKYELIKTDVVIIGAGVVGCAIARALVIAFPGKRIAIIEKHHLPGQETSRLNSNVIHSGLHEPPDSLKAKFARRGSELIVEYAVQNDLRIYKSGMLVAVPWKHALADPIDKLKSLVLMKQNSKKQETKVEFLTHKGIKKYESSISAVCGIFIPDVWIADAESLVKRLCYNAMSGGVGFYFNNETVGIDTKGGIYEVSTPDLKIQARAVINAAGLGADMVAAMAGFKYELEFWRGEYYEVKADKAGLIRRLIYPAIPSGSPSKGIHFSPRLNGRLFVGPNARLVAARDFYNEDKTPVGVFCEAASLFCSQIKEADLKWSYSGIRPKIKNWQSGADFIIRLDAYDPPIINLIGIESPGLTASMAIAEYVSEILKPQLI